MVINKDLIFRIGVKKKLFEWFCFWFSDIWSFY